MSLKKSLLPFIKVGSAVFQGLSFLFIFIFLMMFFEYMGTAPVIAQNSEEINEGDKDILVFSYELQEYSYTLEELGLGKMKGFDEYGLRYMLYCENPAKLSYRLYVLSQKIYKPARDASIEVDDEGKPHIIPEQQGVEMDLSSLIVMLGNPGPYQERIAVPVFVIEPRVTKEELEFRLPEVLWAQYTTTLADIPDRTENVRIASEKFNGLVIAPGQVISFNEIVGPRDQEGGFREAKIIVAGRFEEGMGGGVCQVSSTLYNALLLGGVEIVERHPHTVRIAYVPVGRDATVVFDQKDLKFRNNSEGYLMIKAGLEGLKLTFSLYGTEKKPYDLVEVNSKIVKTIPYAKVVVGNESLKPGEQKTVQKGQLGYWSETYRRIVTGEGTSIELVSKDRYSPISAIIAVKKPDEAISQEGSG